MSIIKKIIFIIFLTTFVNQVNAEEIKKMGKHKDWETYIIKSEKGKVCFAQSKPVLQAPKKSTREARLFVSFRPAENIKNEISVTNGYEFKLKAPVSAKSGKRTYNLFSKGRFAWAEDKEEDQKLITTMRKASRLMIIGNSEKGEQTTDHYSMMGFTKAYNAAKKSCS